MMSGETRSWATTCCPCRCGRAGGRAPTGCDSQALSGRRRGGSAPHTSPLLLIPWANTPTPQPSLTTIITARHPGIPAPQRHPSLIIITIITRRHPGIPPQPPQPSHFTIITPRHPGIAPPPRILPAAKRQGKTPAICFACPPFPWNSTFLFQWYC